MLRKQQNREYSNCKKTSSPACCNIRCCGSHFGRKSKRHNNKPEMRRYHRHATKVTTQSLMNELLNELIEDSLEIQEILIDFGLIPDINDEIEYFDWE